jgi:hypothetical protein
MQTVLTFILRLVFVVAGLVFAAGLAVVFAVVIAVWILRAGWSKLTGKPVSPFVVRVDPRGGFERMVRRGGDKSGTSAQDGLRTRPPAGGVTDVEYREPGA